MYHSSVYVASRFEIVVFGGRTERGIVGDVAVLSISNMTWRTPPTRLAGRIYHRSFLAGRWMVTVGGTNGEENLGLSLVDTADWNEIRVREYGNVPFGLVAHAVVQMEETRAVVFGGTDALTHAAFSTAYVLDLTGGLIERTPTPIAAPIATPIAAPITAPIATPIAAPIAAPIATPIAAPTGAGAGASPRRDPPKEAPRVGIKPKEKEKPKPAPEDEIFKELKIDISRLKELEKTGTRMKAKKIAAVRKQNAEAVERVTRLERMLAGNFELLPHTPLLLKIFDDAAKATTILRVTSDDDADALALMIARRVLRPTMLTVQLGAKRTAPLTAASLAEAHAGICKGELRALVIVAL
jgi:hypothetical protein